MRNIRKRNLVVMGLLTCTVLLVTIGNSKQVYGSSGGKAVNVSSSPSSLFSIEGTDQHTVQQFIAFIQQDAQEISRENDLYASVMISQAIIASNSGKSEISQPPVNNLFAIKGKNANQYIPGDTNAYKKYSSWRASMEDYAKLIREGNGFSANYYEGVWRSNTQNYENATAALNERYATDPKYSENLNDVIRNYDLTKYDETGGSAQQLSSNPTTNHVQASGEEKDEEQSVEDTASGWQKRRVHSGENLWDIAKEYQVNVQQLMKENGLSSSAILGREEILVPER